MPHYFQPWNVAADGILGLVRTRHWAINTAGSVAPGYVVRARAGGAGIPPEGGAGKDFPSRGTRVTRPPDPQVQGCCSRPWINPLIRGCRAPLWAEPRLGSEEAEVEPDRVAVLQETDQRYWGTFSQERAEGVHGREHLWLTLSALSLVFSTRSMPMA